MPSVASELEAASAPLPHRRKRIRSGAGAAKDAGSGWRHRRPGEFGRTIEFLAVKQGQHVKRLEFGMCRIEGLGDGFILRGSRLAACTSLPPGLGSRAALCRMAA